MDKNSENSKNSENKLYDPNKLSDTPTNNENNTTHNPPSLREINVFISGIHCASCVANLEKALLKLDGIIDVNISIGEDINSNKGFIKFNPDKININAIDTAVEDTGFNIIKDEAIIPIGGIHCAVCVENIEKALNNLEGVIEATVNLSSQKAYIKYIPQLVTLNAMGDIIEGLGFEVLSDNYNEGKLNIDKNDNKNDNNDNDNWGGDWKENTSSNSSKTDEYYLKDLKNKRNKIIIGFTVSGIMMALMLIPAAHHFTMAIAEALSISMSALFLIISIIPFIYVSGPIIKAGYNSLSHKNLDMDVMYTIGILVAFISSLMGTFNIILDSSFMFYETAIMLAAFLNLGRYLEAKAKKKTSSSIKSLIGMQPKIATLLVPTDSTNSNFTEQSILIKDIGIGDFLIVKPGEKIPTDGEVFDGNSYVDESMITGEPIPKEKMNKSNIYAGTINQDGILKIKATKVGKDTILSQIIELVEKAQGSKPPVQKIANRVVAYFIPTIIIIAIASFLFWIISGASLLFALTALISVLVVACPCALGLATPTAVTVGIGRAAEYGILIKNGSSLENSANINYAVFDKTGTITQGTPTVSDVYINKSNSSLNLKEEFENIAQLSTDGTISHSELLLIILATVEKNSTHPIAKAIVSKANEINNSLNIDDVVEKITHSIFNFENISGKGIKANLSINKKEYKILTGNKAILEDENISISKESKEYYEIFENQNKTTIFLVINNEIAGIISLSDKIKENSSATISELNKMNIETYMLTGDNAKTAESVANAVGIKNTKAEVLPGDKLREIKNIQKNGSIVAFVGDGINDAPAITGSDVGIALGSGTDIAMESGDIVLIDGDLEDVVATLQLSRKIMNRIKQNIFWAFAYNIILVPVAAGALFIPFGILFRPEFAGLAMALSSVTVISLSLTLKSYVPSIKKS
ncbi:MAG: heavy metal translocating P-type ATPase [Methanobacteriaceae archaeon]